MSFTQENRNIAIMTPLGADVMLLHRVRAKERLGRLSEITVDMLSTQVDVNVDDMLGQTGTVALLTGTGSTRYFSGFFNQVSRIGMHGEFYHYRATIVPWLWFLTRTADCRIFQEKNVPDIIKDVFRELGFTDFEDKLSGTYPARDYCVQYRESAFDFVSRLMEQEGIYYYIVHGDGTHKVVLADGYSSHESSDGYDSINFFPPNEAGAKLREHVYEWVSCDQVESGVYTHTDFDFENPQSDLNSVSQVNNKHGHAKLEVYDYPGEYSVLDEGNRYSKVRMEEMQSRYRRVRGESNVAGLRSGALFSLAGHWDPSQADEYLLISTDLELQNNEYVTGEESEETTRCKFEAILSSTPFRSLRTTRLPHIRGPQTAIVVGPSNEEIWTDKYGRVKVQFHWDRLGKNDENSSCWVRVAQSWAGKKWGTIHTPRIGQEVLIEFLEGDPDRPIITGRVYNADLMPPYALPDNQTQSGIKTRSTTKGNDKTFNELRFEDKIGEEQIYFHAERDFERVVENNDTLKVGYETKEDGDQVIEIFNNQKVTIGDSKASDGSQTITIKNNYTQTVSEGDATIEISKGNRSTVISKGDDELTISAGLQSTEASKSITLKVGQSSIKIEPAAITISSSKVVVDAKLKAEIKSVAVDAKASGILTLKGGLTKIN